MTYEQSSKCTIFKMTTIENRVIQGCLKICISIGNIILGDLYFEKKKNNRVKRI